MSAPKGRGRPTKLTPELVEQIGRKLRKGMPVELAAEACGVSRRTVHEWVQRGEGGAEGRPPDQAFEDFAHTYRQSKALAAEMWLDVLTEAVLGRRPSKKRQGEWVKSRMSPMRVGAAQWLLARTFPQHWGSGRESGVFLDPTDSVEAAEDTKIEIIYGPDPLALPPASEPETK